MTEISGQFQISEQFQETYSSLWPCHSQPINRVPTGLLLSNSLTFQVVEWQCPWPYQNNNPITQMLEMVHYIPRFIITMKHVIYEHLSAARESGEHCKLPQWGLAWNSSGKQIWCILAWKSDICSTNFSFSLTFTKQYFPRTFPRPLKFPGFFQFSLTCRNPE